MPTKKRKQDIPGETSHGLNPTPGLQGSDQLLYEHDVCIREARCPGVFKSAGGDGGWGLGAEDGQTAGGKPGVLFGPVGFRNHENIIGFVICAKGLGSEVEEIHWIDDPAIGQAETDACQQCENNENPAGAIRLHRKKYPDR